MSVQILLRPTLTVAAVLSMAIAGGAQQSAPKAVSKQPSASPASSAKAPAPSEDKVVLKVGGQKITQSEFEAVVASLGPRAEQAMAHEGPKPLGDEYALLLALAQRAEQDHLEASLEIQRELAFQKMKTMAQAEYNKLAGQTKVSPDEIKQYYTAHSPQYQQAEVREFVVLKKEPGAAANAPGLSAQDAKAKADAIRKAVASGEDIEKVAKEFAAPNAVTVDKATRTVRQGQLVPDLDKAVFSLKDGELTPTLDTAKAIAFLQVVSHHQQDLQEVSSEIENVLRQQKLNAAIADLKKSASIWMDEDYFKAPASPPAAHAPAPKPPKP